MPSQSENSTIDTMLTTSGLLVPQFSSVLTLCCYLQMHIYYYCYVPLRQCSVVSVCIATMKSVLFFIRC